MKVLHLNSYDYRGGSETVFNLSRFNPNIEENFAGYVKVDKTNSFQSDINFSTWELDGKILGAFNYIYSSHNFRSLKRFLLNNNVDIIHLHNIFSALSPSIFSALKSLKPNRKFKILQTVHDYHMICPNANLFNYSKDKLCESCIGKKLKLDIIYKNCDRRGWAFSFIKGVRNFVSNNVIKYEKIIDLFITPSEFLKTKLIEDGVESEKIIVLRNPIVLKDNRLQDKKNIICYFGRFSQEKNVGFLIDAFIKWQEQRKNDFVLLLIGEGEEESELKQKASNSQFKNKILFKPFLPHNILMKEIGSAKYFAMSSKWYENAPMVIIEAVANGLIPIVPNLGGMVESIENVVKVGKTYQSENFTSWIETMNELERSYGKELLRLNESIKLLMQYNLENYLIRLNDIYREIIKDN